MNERNVFTEAWIIGDNTRPEDYRQQTPGIKRGDPAYVMSRSALMDFAACPHAWVKGRDGEEDDTSSTEWGTLLDTLLLSPERVSAIYAITPPTYPGTPKKKGDPIVQKPWNRGATYCAEWEEAQAGKTIIKADVYAEARKAAHILGLHAEADHLIKCSQTSVLVTAQYADPDTRIVVPLKFLLDLVPAADDALFGRSVADLKTATTIAPRAWRRQVFDKHYDAQAAMYLDAYVAATGEDRVDFVHLMQENSHPFETAVTRLTDNFLVLGRFKYRSALARYCNCLATGKWPSYWTDAQPQIERIPFVDPEPWMMEAAA